MIKTNRRLRLLRAVALGRVTWRKEDEMPYFCVHESGRGVREMTFMENLRMRQMDELSFFGLMSAEEMLTDRGELRVSPLGRETLAGWLA
jgi:hypothetical protein